MIQKIFKNKKGFSMLELVIALGIFGIIIVIISNIVIINIRIASINKARTRAREETGFVLTQIKRDIRNASKAKILNAATDPTTCSAGIDRIVVETDPPSGSTVGKIYYWTLSGNQIAKYEITSVSASTFTGLNCTNTTSGTLITKMPSDIFIQNWKIILPRANTLVTNSQEEVAQITIIIEARMDLPNSGIFGNSITVKKQTIIATRNFIVQQY